MTDDASLAWETIERTRVHACEAFEVFTDRVRLPDGREARFDFVREPPSAVVLGLTADDGVVVLEEYRHAVERVALGLPGGSREPADASMAETAERELFEEAGYRASSFERFLVAEPANGLLDSERHYFVAHDCEPSGRTDRDHDESMRVTTLPYDDLVGRIVAGEVHDERTVTGVLAHRARTRGDESKRP
ncbi:MAG: NUDIX hydrolase [Halobacteriota archaeon]